MKKFLKVFPVVFILTAFTIFGYYYHMQEKLIFRFKKLEHHHEYAFDSPFEEVHLTLENGDKVNGLHFFHEKPKGVIYYLHGQGNNLAHWGKRAQQFVDYGYDVFVIDYRGCGKSVGDLTEKTLMVDSMAGYNYLKARYNEDQIVIHGVSLGTAMASFVSSHHNPKMCILVSPYYNMIEAAHYNKPVLPRFVLHFILKYHLRTDTWIGKCNCPLYIFHGVKDRLIPYSQSEMIMASLEETNVDSTLYTLKDCGHNYIHNHKEYLEKVEELLK
ncbi:alpha/beta fold hydrolase [bacterium]|nr:alpha/beta fold hydrolase [bacterium]